MAETGRICDSLNCDKPANLQCPTCKKLNIVDGSFFCEQNCFKANWKSHKILHKKAESDNNRLLQLFNNNAIK